MISRRWATPPRFSLTRSRNPRPLGMFGRLWKDQHRREGEIALGSATKSALQRPFAISSGSLKETRQLGAETLTGGMSHNRFRRVDGGLSSLRGNVRNDRPYETAVPPEVLRIRRKRSRSEISGTAVTSSFGSKVWYRVSEGYHYCTRCM